MTYDIFISYKRKTLPTASNLYYRLTYDVTKIVWEWTEAPTHSYASDVKPDGTIFIRRGGSWWHEAKNCRVSRRYASDHTKKTSGLGLRVVIRD